ncbi:MAG: aminotransferase class V-fold PLP-dependent enzyme [Candidatus Eremiobacteraeota bacterium]|nr:aminotransferase class V-fold PLP-dependent enzyme [Candidatus Eremiobacteraeota bacterium]
MNQDRFPAVMGAASYGRILADNAAGTQLPDRALERVQHYLAYDNAQKGGIFARTLKTSELVAEAKAEFAALVDAPVGRVGIGLNATSIAMSFSRLLASAIGRGDRIVVTAADHEANVAPWIWLRRFGAQIDIVPVDAHGDLDESKYRAFLERAPVLVALPWASNATGTVFDVAHLARLAKSTRAIVVVDGVQAFPHFALEIDPAIDFAFFSAYKMYAPHMGFWYASDRVLDRFVHAGDAEAAGGDARYWTLECGTQSHEALAGWLGTMAYFRDVAAMPRLALELFARHEFDLSAYARQKFRERKAAVQLYGLPAEAPRLPVFAFNIPGMPSDDLAERFEAAHIEARVGDYYAPRLMGTIAAGAGGRAVRLSFAHYNTTEEVDRCFETIDAAVERMRYSRETATDVEVVRQ